MRALFLQLFGLILAMCVGVNVNAFSVPTFFNKPRATTLLATPAGEKAGPVKRVVNKVKKVSKKVVDKVKKSEPSQDKLAEKYADIDCVSERAYQVLLDLDMITENKGKVRKL
eukprot:CAMPEP_0117077716 /NCGR_PEP_ID=MMETSP0472-20121206/54782_1 /TAXON_ID=693140 ORGANISM="Tiarina fusus, Strain LIS" /NCGR_SAMPLE_ID=MMETSP0472 /ASSEMBLY_ACC=CAM_ASM_000603 /LENGTH=112 /DNA_ID=CAMNT_0004804135 /DNA_START=95 /DNA_END=436 /DNA_ORIENTATION=+